MTALTRGKLSVKMHSRHTTSGSRANCSASPYWVGGYSRSFSAAACLPAARMALRCEWPIASTNAVFISTTGRCKIARLGFQGKGFCSSAGGEH